MILVVYSATWLAGRSESAEFIDLPGFVVELPVHISCFSGTAGEFGAPEYVIQLHSDGSVECEIYETIPEDVLVRLSLLKQWSLAGNYIEYLTTDQLMHIDKVLHCERLQLASLHLNGQNLTHLHAHHNMLDCLIVMPVPLHLVFIDISHNIFDSLPDWICDLPQIECLIVHNNRLTNVPNRLRHLNVSFNRLTGLPAMDANVDRNRLNVLRLSSNRLNESIMPILMKMKRLKILDLSRNKLRYFDDRLRPSEVRHIFDMTQYFTVLFCENVDENSTSQFDSRDGSAAAMRQQTIEGIQIGSALSSLSLLEELNLSSNELTTLSPSIFKLPALQVLKAHSNHIKSIPDLSLSPTLQILDLSNNALGKCTTCIDAGCSLNLLDLTCNSALSLTSETLRRNQKKPVTLYDIGDQAHDRVLMGFSETSGNRNKSLYHCYFCFIFFTLRLKKWKKSQEETEKVLCGNEPSWTASILTFVIDCEFLFLYWPSNGSPSYEGSRAGRSRGYLAYP
ncbi:unnamed protein product [Angiostrongylus costaricensis]|uniref:PPM-type phosphatase domain-containing protein n=1 Tax=Angiostrongylus costaricensis TaxID=334426 RepID=A0A0R3Q227_ANGCS|nr:unnamed protein product [Angiostrongylus costaricensis]